jgi:hypothetical protein
LDISSLGTRQQNLPLNGAYHTDQISTELDLRFSVARKTAFSEVWIDWSIGAVDQDVCAVISGPNGFYANNRIKASQDFSWIRRGEGKFRSVRAIAIVVQPSFCADGADRTRFRSRIYWP